MALNNFKNRLLEVSRCVSGLKDFLQEYVNVVLDKDEYNIYDRLISEVIFDLNNVRIDCENLVNEMRLNGDIKD